MQLCVKLKVVFDEMFCMFESLKWNMMLNGFKEFMFCIVNSFDIDVLMCDVWCFLPYIKEPYLNVYVQTWKQNTISYTMQFLRIPGDIHRLCKYSQRLAKVNTLIRSWISLWYP